MKHKLIFVVLAGLAVIGLETGCKREAEPPSTKPSPPVAVKMTQPRHGDIVRTVSLPALIAADQQTTLYAKVTGYLKAIKVDKGDEVKAGDVLAEIEAPELLADLAKSKAESEAAEIEFRRSSDAQKKAPDLISPQTIDAAKGKYEMARAGMARAETLLGFCKITAPFDGIVTKRFVDVGAFIPAASAGSSPQGSALLSVANFKTVRVQVAVPEPEVPLIVKGVTAKVMVEELPGRKYEGTVTRFAHALDDSTKTMLTEIDLDNAKGELRPGMYATVKLGVEKHSDVLLLPVEALLVEKSGPSVFMVVENKAKKIPVKIGFNDGVSAEIQEGVKSNDSVILIGKLTLNNGQPVTVSANQ
jgi:membrane fusion protein (multidrug efflux system)